TRFHRFPRSLSQRFGHLRSARILAHHRRAQVKLRQATPVQDFDEDQVRRRLEWRDLIPAMERALAAFSSGASQQPVRTVLRAGDANRFFGIMPAIAGEVMGVKAVTFYPD